MKSIYGLGAMMAAAFGIPASAQADTSLTYDNAMRCSAMYIVTAEKVGEDDPIAAERLEETAIRWFRLASKSDDASGARAHAEIESVVDALVGQLDGFGEDETARTDFANRQFKACDDLRAANADEYGAVDIVAE